MSLLPILNGPLTDAVEKSLEKSIRSTVENPGVFPPPPNQPQLEFPVAAKAYLAKLNGPLGDAVPESFAKSIRSTVDNGPVPPPNQP